MAAAIHPAGKPLGLLPPIKPMIFLHANGDGRLFVEAAYSKGGSARGSGFLNAWKKDASPRPPVKPKSCDGLRVERPGERVAGPDGIAAGAKARKSLAGLLLLLPLSVPQWLQFRFGS